MIKPHEFDAKNVTTKMQKKLKGYKCMIPLERM